MTLASFSFPVVVVVFFASLVFAMIVARLVGRKGSKVDTVILNAVLIGLVVARVSFVLHYLPSYDGHIIRMFDFRDLGFDAIPGAIAGAIILLWSLKRQPEVRRAAMVAATLGVVSWGVATAVTGGKPRVGIVPDVSLVDISGNTHSLVRNSGKPLVVNLWASWCGPCRAEIPALVAEQYDVPGVDLVFVNEGESRETISKFIEFEGINMPNLLLDQTLATAKAVDARAFPTTLFYDAHGVLLEVHLGALSQATFQQALHKLYPGVTASEKLNRRNG